MMPSVTVSQQYTAIDHQQILSEERAVSITTEEQQ